MAKKIKVMLGDGGIEPTRAHETDAGLDIYSPVYKTVPAHGSAVIDTKVHIELPKGYAGILMSKSGLNINYDITSEGVIDCGYTGSIRVKLYNSGQHPYFIEPGDKVSQLLIIPIDTPKVEIVSELSETERGANGFGSTGR